MSEEAKVKWLEVKLLVLLPKKLALPRDQFLPRSKSFPHLSHLHLHSTKDWSLFIQMWSQSLHQFHPKNQVTFIYFFNFVQILIEVFDGFKYATMQK